MSQLFDYTVYKKADGEIYQWGTSSSKIIPSEGYAVILGVSADNSKYYVLNGNLVEYTLQQRESKVNRKRNCHWSNTSFSWVTDFSELELYNFQCNSVKTNRDTLLSDSDWVIIKATDTGTPIPTAWQEYRQQLRDVTTQLGYPFNIVWPTKPEN